MTVHRKTAGRRARAGAPTWRPERPEDAEVVRRAHGAHRTALFAPLGWPADALARLCDQQHDLQERHIAAHHPQAERWMIEQDGVALGRLCLDTSVSPWRLVDIALLPEGQGRGIGTAVLHRVMTAARTDGADVDLHVALDNPRAEALYRRLGFVDAIAAVATHRRLIWTPRAGERTVS